MSLSNLVPGRHTRYTVYLEGQIHYTRHFNVTYSLSISSWTGCKDIIELNENLYQQTIHPLKYTYTHYCKNLSESSFELFYLLHCSSYLKITAFSRDNLGGKEKRKEIEATVQTILHNLKILNWQTGGKRQNTTLKFECFSVFKYICSGNPKWRPRELLGFAKPWIHNVHLTAGCKRWRDSFCRLASFSDWCIFDITDAVGRRSLWRIMGTDEQGSVRGRYGELYSFTKWARCGVSVTWQRINLGPLKTLSASSWLWVLD